MLSHEECKYLFCTSHFKQVFDFSAEHHEGNCQRDYQVISPLLGFATGKCGDLVMISTHHFLQFLIKSSSPKRFSTYNVNEMKTTTTKKTAQGVDGKKNPDSPQEVTKQFDQRAVDSKFNA